MARIPKRRLRRVYLLPNLFTAFNLALGVLAIFNVVDGNFEKACWYVIWAAILDGLDGAVARLTHSTSEFGLQFDSLSDLVSFGVAPATIAFWVMKQYLPDVHVRLAVGVCVLFAICGALRLGRYNVQAKSSERKGFLGLPIPGGACGVVLYVLAMVRHEWLERSFAVGLLPFAVLGLGLLMVSEVPYPSVMRRLRIERRMSFDSLVSLIMIFGLIMFARSDMRVTIFFVLCYVYVFYGLAFWGVARMRQGSDDTAEPAEPTGGAPSV